MIYVLVSRFPVIWSKQLQYAIQILPCKGQKSTGGWVVKIKTSNCSVINLGPKLAHWLTYGDLLVRQRGKPVRITQPYEIRLPSDKHFSQTQGLKHCLSAYWGRLLAHTCPPGKLRFICLTVDKWIYKWTSIYLDLVEFAHPFMKWQRRKKEQEERFQPLKVHTTSTNPSGHAAKH